MSQTREILEPQKGLRGAGARRVPVFMYHHIGPYPPGCCEGLSITPEVFERQIRWLARRGFNTIRTADWMAWIREAKPLPTKPLLLTFDDAYADTARHALPVLQRYGFSGVLFVVTTTIGGTNAWDEAVGYPTLRIMTAEEIRYWAGQGIEFGAHTRTHPDLTGVSPEQLEDEIAGSGADLGEILQTRVSTFAYPYGFFNLDAQRAASRAFDLSFTTQEGVNTLDTDPHGLLRATVLPGDGWMKLEWRARFGFDPVKRLRNYYLPGLYDTVASRVRPAIVKACFGSAEENDHRDAQH